MQRSLGHLLCELHARMRWSDGELTVAEGERLANQRTAIHPTRLDAELDRAAA